MPASNDPHESRAERRRRERAQAKGRPVVGVFTEAGQYESASAHGRLPTKVPGQHRWIAAAAYVLTDEMVNLSEQEDGAVHLDHETRFSFSIGCYDCELPYPDVRPGTHCAALQWED